MKFWFVHSGEVSLREQLIAQVHLGIASGDLRPGERLPSTRAMAQRYGLHANTVSAAYRELESLGRVEMRKGSGVYIREFAAAREPLSVEERLDVMVRMFVESLRATGFEASEIRRALQRWTSAETQRRLALVEPDGDLQEIVLLELKDAGIEVAHTYSNGEEIGVNEGVTVLALPSKVQQLREILPAEISVFPLQINSVPQQLLKQGHIPTDALIGVASRWKEFLRLAETMLLAAGVPAECLVIRDAKDPEWQEGFDATDAVVCDVVTCAQLPKNVRTIPFRLLAADGLKGLQ